MAHRAFYLPAVAAGRRIVGSRAADLSTGGSGTALSAKSETKHQPDEHRHRDGSVTATDTQTSTKQKNIFRTDHKLGLRATTRTARAMSFRHRTLSRAVMMTRVQRTVR